MGRKVATGSAAPAIISANVPARAPAGPPVMGVSTAAMPRAASPAAMRSMAGRPIVDISPWMRMARPWTTPSGPSAAASLTSPLGRHASTMPAASATSLGEPQATAPRATKGATASGRGSNTWSRRSGPNSRSAIGAPI